MWPIHIIISACKDIIRVVFFHQNNYNGMVKSEVFEKGSLPPHQKYWFIPPIPVPCRFSLMQWGYFESFWIEVIILNWSDIVLHPVGEFCMLGVSELVREKAQDSTTDPVPAKLVVQVWVHSFQWARPKKGDKILLLLVQRIPPLSQAWLTPLCIMPPSPALPLHCLGGIYLLQHMQIPCWHRQESTGLPTTWAYLVCCHSVQYATAHAGGTLSLWHSYRLGLCSK